MNSPFDLECDELRPEYYLSQLKGKVPGKYVERYRAGTNVNADLVGDAIKISSRSALDVAGIDLEISTKEIVEIVREGRERL